MINWETLGEIIAISIPILTLVGVVMNQIILVGLSIILLIICIFISYVKGKDLNRTKNNMKSWEIIIIIGILIVLILLGVLSTSIEIIYFLVSSVVWFIIISILFYIFSIKKKGQSSISQKTLIISIIVTILIALGTFYDQIILLRFCVG